VVIWISGISSAFIEYDLLLLSISQLFCSLHSNIPYTTTLIPVIVNVAKSLDLPLTVMVWALVYGTCLGGIILFSSTFAYFEGNGTIIGASANVVCVSLAEKEGSDLFLPFVV
jgi:Na+/H+ antiporter NhaD/arsenite permease-like protein